MTSHLSDDDAEAIRTLAGRHLVHADALERVAERMQAAMTRWGEAEDLDDQEVRIHFRDAIATIRECDKAARLLRALVHNVYGSIVDVSRIDLSETDSNVIPLQRRGADGSPPISH